MRKPFVVLLLGAVLACGCSNDSASKIEDAASRQAQKLETSVKNGASAAKIKAVLMASGKLDASHINVDKEKDVFRLRGTVTNAEQHKLALRLAQDTAGQDEKIIDDLKEESPNPQ